MRVLMIDDATKDRIRAAVERARAKPLPWETLKPFALSGVQDIALSDRKPGSERVIASQSVLIPDGYRAAISFERQPAGLLRHLSVSVDAPGRVPNAPAMEMIAREFGFALPLSGPHSTVWLEEFEPGHRAVNVLQIAEYAA